MAKKKKKESGCGYGSIPFLVILLISGVGGWWLSQEENRQLGRYFTQGSNRYHPCYQSTHHSKSILAFSLSRPHH